MNQLKKYDITGAKTGDVKVTLQAIRSPAIEQTIKDYIVAVRENMRQWSASTLGRKEVNHSGKKPHRQKGTGNARQGCLAAPQYKGGGVVFGPKPKFDQHVHMNRKQKRAAVYALLSAKVKEERVIILQAPQLKTPKTKVFADFFKKVDCGRTLVLKEASTSADFAEVRSRNEALQKSLRNLQKVECMSIGAVSGYDIARAKTIIVLEPAEKAFVQWMETTNRETAE